MAKEKKITFEQALERLEEIVSQIEEGKVPLEESIEKYAEGIKLIGQCRGILDKAEKKIQLLTKGQGQTLEPAGQLTGQLTGEDDKED
ncbi:MAG: exodeoxyribonuclease VII small subunit [Phycisphaerae bacterium]|nr:exodeoxyribonuclease VII small subunit [Phycisphaerae bacterium]